MIEVSTFFLKPEGMPHKKEISSQIQSAGLSIVVMRETILTLEMLNALYERHTKTAGHELYWSTIREELEGKKVCVGIVRGDDAISRFVAICGESTKPEKCASQSIRRRFGVNLKPIDCGELRYWRNVIHRAKNPEEVMRDFRLFFPEVSKK